MGGRKDDSHQLNPLSDLGFGERSTGVSNESKLCLRLSDDIVSNSVQFLVSET